MIVAHDIYLSHLLQSQFLLDGSFSDSQWIIPITLSYGSYDTQKTFLLNSKSAKLNLKDQGNQENSQTTWIKLNMNQVGLYKVQYDNELTTRLRNAIQANELSAMDKYGTLIAPLSTFIISFMSKVFFFTSLM